MILSSRSFDYTMKVDIVPALDDNYMYLVYDEDALVGCIVDGVQPEKVLERASQLNIKIQFVLTTHHHHDHSGGNSSLKQLLNVPIVGGIGDGVPCCSKEVSEGDSFQIGNLFVSVLSTPCHTRGHVLYLFRDPLGNQALFTGDTLFIGGCGRFFEGSAAQMHTALNEKIAQLDASTLVYCGHEYTMNNLLFASSVEPENPCIMSFSAFCSDLISKGLPTVPSSVGTELLINPFMRVHEPAVQEAMGTTDEVSTMSALRSAKNSFGLGSKILIL